MVRMIRESFSDRVRTLRRWVKRTLTPSAAPRPIDAIMEVYCRHAPSPQNALDIFGGEWSSRLPSGAPGVTGGACPLFEDSRVTRGLAMVGGAAGKRVLELGPLEGAHSVMLEQAGAAEVVAVEANTRAYLKCLIVKELFGLTRARFLCGDLMEYLAGEPGRFDLVLNCGVLYHMRSPAETIARLAAVTDDMILWTHYYDEPVIRANPVLSRKFPSRSTAEYAGFRHTLHYYDYDSAMRWKGFCGGTAVHSNWMQRAALLDCLRHFGFNELTDLQDDPTHPNGPNLLLVARKTRG